MATGKADFSDVYVQPDPRDYYSTLLPLDYEIPAHGCDVFQRLIDELRQPDAGVTVLDVCCSYGVNAALLNHDIDLEEIETHYQRAEGLSRQELLERDRRWLDANRHTETVEVIGLDASEPAVRYAVDCGLLVDGVVADLEEEPLSDEDAAKVADVDLVTVSGGVGYVKEQTFGQILDAADEPPWVAALVLRWIDFDGIAATLESRGLVTEKADELLVPQRRFIDESERDFVLAELTARGIDPSGVEADGHHYAEVYLARPPEAVEAAPVQQLLKGLPQWDSEAR
jgi:SAM-dependent methyltransferase